VKDSNRRTAILASSAPIFNRKGYAGTSIADILAATSLEKGGLYNHFASKEELAIEAFDFAWSQVKEYFVKALRGTESGTPRLHVYIDAFARYIDRPVVEGGCPLANAALEADDALPFLQDRVASAWRYLRTWLLSEVERAINKGQLPADTDRGAVSDFIISALEGAMTLSRGLRSRRSMRNVATTLHAWLRGIENAKSWGAK
jgi:AcrR family transcriptional regulator